jgi:hypothetical protein
VPVLAATLAALVVAAAAGAASTAARRYRADLVAGNEVPAAHRVPQNAGGRFIGKLTGRKLDWTLRLHTLSGTATSAALLLGSAGQTGPVVATLCAPCTTSVTGTTTLTHPQIAALNAKRLYVNVSTGRNPSGEVRGQVYRR